MADETNYVHEDATPNPVPKFFSQRWVKITGISLVAAVALVGAFGAGVVAGERLGGGNQSLGGDDHFGQQFGGGMQGGQQFGGPQGGSVTGDARSFDQHGFPGGCPADDPDHCAGTDRGQHDFQVPNNTNGGATSGTNSTNGTSNP